MKKYIVLGAGLMGEVAAYNLLEVEHDAQVTLTDLSSNQLDKAKTRINNPRLNVKELDIKDRENSVSVITGHDAAIDCLPIPLSVTGIEASIEAKVPLTGLNGEHPEEKYALQEKALEADIIIIPGIGVAPGLSHVLTGRGVELLDSAENAVIYVGGLPQKKEPPLDYKTVYSLESVVYYYSEPAHIFRDGRETVVEPLSGIETVNFPEPIGDLEAFYTDGLTSLFTSMKGRVSGHLAEKTLRFPGHAAKINLLKECGLFSTKRVSTSAGEVSPRELLFALLGPKLKLDESGDLLVMRVIVDGLTEDKSRKHIFDLIDYYDRTTGFTAMARTTTFPATTAARLIASGRIKAKGVVFPENALCGDMFDTYIEDLNAIGIKISHSVE